MSNYVTVRNVTITETEYNQLRDEATNNANMLGRANQINAELQSRLDDAENRVQAINQANTQAISALRDQNRAIIARNEELQTKITEAYESIRENNEKNKADINRLRVDLSDYVNDAITTNNRIIEKVIDENQEKITAMIDDLREETTKTIANVANDFNNFKGNLINQAQVLVDSAEDFLDQAVALEEEISNTTRHEILLPGRLAELQVDIARARGDVAGAQLNSFLSAVAYDHARSALEGALSLLEDVALAEQEWQAQFALAQQLASLLEAQLANSAYIMPKKGTEIEIDVNFWSNGDLEAERNIFDDVCATLNDPEVNSNFSIKDLTDIQEKL